MGSCQRITLYNHFNIIPDKASFQQVALFGTLACQKGIKGILIAYAKKKAQKSKTVPFLELQRYV
jgi:hypothetical protein